MALRALQERRDEGDVARHGERAELPQTKPVGEYDDDLPYALTERRLERAQRRGVGLIANAEYIEHRCRDVDEAATVVVGRHEAARA